MFLKKIGDEIIVWAVKSFLRRIALKSGNVFNKMDIFFLSTIFHRILNSRGQIDKRQF